MKRAILVLMVVVFALVTVVPTFALSQDFHGVTVPQIIDPNDGIGIAQTIVLEDGVIMPNGGELKSGIIWDGTIVLEEGRIIAIRKAGGNQQDYL